MTTSGYIGGVIAGVMCCGGYLKDIAILLTPDEAAELLSSASGPRNIETWAQMNLELYISRDIDILSVAPKSNIAGFALEGPLKGTKE